MLKRLAGFFRRAVPETSITTSPSDQGDKPSRMATEAAQLQHAEVLKNQGNSYFQNGCIEEALRCYQDAVRIAPGYAQGHNNLGLLLKRKGQSALAREHFLKAIQSDASLHQPYQNLGDLALSEGLLGDAALHFDKALQRAPNNEGVLISLIQAWSQGGDLAKAEGFLRARLESSGPTATLFCLLGNVMRLGDRPAEAELAYRRCLAEDPAYPMALLNLGSLLHDRRELEEAEMLLRRAAQLSGYVDAEIELAYLRLFKGDLIEGFSLLDKRFETENKDYAYLAQHLSRVRGRPRWQGEPLDGRRLLVWGEQGLGDSLMMARFLPALRARGAGEVILDVQPHLVRLFSVLGLGHRVISQADADPRPAFDLHCSMMSLPGLLGVDLEGLRSYAHTLSMPLKLTAPWAPRLDAIPGLKVGIVWAGNPEMKQDAKRSVPLQQWAPVLATEGVSFISLQKGGASLQLSQLAVTITDWMDECDDMLDTAALVAGLDLLICVDTSVAHLASVLGKPVWLLNRHGSEWRWMQNRDDSPWYPEMRIFNQESPGDWSVTMTAIAHALQTMVQMR